MSPSSLLTWLLTFGALGAILAFIFRRSRAFAAHPLAGPRMRQITGLYLPLLEIALLLCLLGVAFFARTGSGASDAGLASGPAQAFLGLAVSFSMSTALLTAVQGFVLSERLKSRGEFEPASQVATRGFFVLLVGAAGVLVTMFAALILANPATGN